MQRMYLFYPLFTAGVPGIKFTANYDLCLSNIHSLLFSIDMLYKSATQPRYNSNTAARLKKCIYYFFFLAKALIKTGSRIRLVSVPDNKVKDVSQPSALVPPKSLKQKIIKPAINTIDV